MVFLCFEFTPTSEHSCPFPNHEHCVHTKNRKRRIVFVTLYNRNKLITYPGRQELMCYICYQGFSGSNINFAVGDKYVTFMELPQT